MKTGNDYKQKPLPSIVARDYQEAVTHLLSEDLVVGPSFRDVDGV